MRLSVFMLTHDRLTLLKTCLKSVLEALPESSEVVLVLNGFNPDTAEWLRGISDPRLRWYENIPELRGLRRNFAFDTCQGDIIHFLDDDVIVPKNIFQNTLAVFDSDPEVTILGGPNVTPEDSPWKEKLFGAMMTSWFSAPMIRRRYISSPWKKGKKASERELILCNLAVRRASISPSIRFSNTLTSNEENLFLYDCRRENLKMLFSTAIPVQHRRRKTLERFLSQIMVYGVGRGQQTAIAPKSCHPAFLTPTLAVVFGLYWLFTGNWACVIPAVALHIALSFVAGCQSREMRELGPRALLAAIPLTMLVHATYGLGFLKGVAMEGRPFLSPRAATSS